MFKAALLIATGCTSVGLHQDFEMKPAGAVTDTSQDVWFDLTNEGGDSPETLGVYRVAIGDRAFSGGLFGCKGPGDAAIDLVTDGGTSGTIDPGDVVRVREYADGMNLRAADNGESLWITMMVLGLDQRSSDALTCSWAAVWSAPWRVGEK